MSITLTLSHTETKTEPYEATPLSLTEQWRKFVEKKRQEKKSPFVSRMYFCVMAATMLYNSLVYLVPYSYNAWGEWNVYYFKVLVCFICVNCVANFACLICYDSSITKTRDRPGLPRHLWETPPDRFIPYLVNHSDNSRRVQNLGGRQCNGMEVKDGIPWSYCTLCDLDLPPRAVHCKTCNKCILKRDHHCYMTGVCVGHYNQRYFIMLSFFTMISCGWAFYLTWSYVTGNFWQSVMWWDFFPPYGIYRMAIQELEPHQFVMVNHLWILPFFSLVGAAYFNSQLGLTALNKTLYEFAKHDPYRSTTKMSRNFQFVFGEFWYLNFIFPAQIIFRQSDDGYYWEGLKRKHSHNV